MLLVYDDFFNELDDSEEDLFGNMEEDEEEDLFSDSNSQEPDTQSFKGGDAEEEEEIDNKSIYKTATIAIVVGLMIILVGFIVVRMIGHRDSPKQQVTHTTSNQQQINQQPSTTIQKQPNNNVSSNNDGELKWVQFGGTDDIDFQQQKVESVFTVTKITNYMLNNADGSLTVKTVALGALSGFIGSYQIELPYSKGHKLSIGKSFGVKVEVGKYNDKVVVGDINYTD